MKLAERRVKRLIKSLPLLVVVGGCDYDATPVSKTCPDLLAGWATPIDGRSQLIDSNRVSLRGYQIFWNKRPITLAQLAEFSEHSRRSNPPFFIEFDPSEAATCQFARSVRDQIHKSAECGSSVPCGQGTQREWNNAMESSHE
jgi:hypothetical protein